MVVWCTYAVIVVSNIELLVRINVVLALVVGTLDDIAHEAPHGQIVNKQLVPIALVDRTEEDGGLLCREGLLADELRLNVVCTARWHQDAGSDSSE